MLLFGGLRSPPFCLFDTLYALLYTRWYRYVNYKDTHEAVIASGVCRSVSRKKRDFLVQIFVESFDL